MADHDACAAASLARGEPLIGTASRVTTWVLVEQHGPWGSDALLESRLDPAVGLALLRRGRATGTRVLLIRRPDRSTPDARRCYLAHTGVRSSWITSLDVDDPAALLDLDWGHLQDATPPPVGDPHTGPLALVCTHGRHDPCCATFGRPVVRALAGAGLDDVWESSHLGGDRFAANVVTLPDGCYFGRVSPEEVAGLVADARRGVLRLDRYRGRSCYPPLLQVAELHAREATGAAELDGLWPAEVEALGRHRLRATFEQAAGGAVRVTVARHRDGSAPLTCTAAPAALWRHELEAVERLGQSTRAE